MSNTLKLPLALILATLLLSGCMPFPGDLPELAICPTTASAAVT